MNNTPYRARDQPESGSASQHRKEKIMHKFEKRDAKSRTLVILAVVGLAAALTLGIFTAVRLIRKPAASKDALKTGIVYDDAAIEGGWDNLSPEEIAEKLNEKVAEGMINISMNTAPYFENGTAEGNVMIVNEAINNYPQQVEFIRNDTQEVIYPKCLLCVENVGYAGTISHPARQNLRVMPVTVNGQPWGFQYSPYVYYNEHAIVMNTQHTPMVIDRSAFDKLFSFVEQFPHYFLGSNADLPIVGGSILAHEHFQGGHHTFPMEKAEKEFGFAVPGFEDVDCCVVKYPMTVLRLNSADKHQLCELAGRILAKWRGYSDPDAMIFAETDGEPHNTITPIARMRNGKYELDLVLRNNLTTPEHPMGLYHPHEELHHIKKENIGLIEVMGLAILPGRLKKEMADLKEALLNGEDLRASETLAKHADWADGFMKRHPEFSADNAEEIIKEEIVQVFAKVLECAGVYKCTEEGRNHLKKFLTEVQNG